MARPRGSTAVLTAWFLAFFVPIAAFKALYVWVIADGDWTLLVPDGPAGPSGAAGWTSLAQLPFQLLARDLVDVALITGALALVRTAVSTRVAATLCAGALAVVMLLGAVNLLAVRETGAPLTRETWDAAWHWTLAHPVLLTPHLTARRLAAVGLASVWLLSPFVLARLLDRPADRAAGRMARVVLPLGLCGLVVAAVASTTLRRSATTAVSPERSFMQLAEGLWRSAFSSGRRMSAEEAANAYRQLAWPQGQDSSENPTSVAGSRTLAVGPRHVVIISLETAPRKFYDLERADLPAFRRLIDHALVGRRHQTTAPMTNLATFSLLTGRYAPPTTAAALSLVAAEPAVSARALPHLLRAHGYDTAFIDSYDLTWNGPAEEELLRRLGFDVVRDARQSRANRSGDPFADRVSADAASLDEALARIDAARARSRQAFVIVATHLGHYDWPRPGGKPRAPGDANPLDHIITALDTLLGQFLDGLEARGLSDSVILVVTGDHGLRFRAEFDALGEPPTFGDTTFHVPLLVHAPALFPAPMPIEATTSHIDLAPTMLQLLGIPVPPDGYHGDVLWDDRLEHRITFLPSGVYPGLRPVDSLRWRNAVYSCHSAIDRVTFRRDGEAAEQPLPSTGETLSADDVRRLLSTARTLFDP